MSRFDPRDRGPARVISVQLTHAVSADRLMVPIYSEEDRGYHGETNWISWDRPVGSEIDEAAQRGVVAP